MILLGAGRFLVEAMVARETYMSLPPRCISNLRLMPRSPARPAGGDRHEHRAFLLREHAGLLSGPNPVPCTAFNNDIHPRVINYPYAFFSQRKLRGCFLRMTEDPRERSAARVGGGGGAGLV